MLRTKPIAAYVAAVFGGAGCLLALPTLAQQTQAQAAQKIERVEVTGSNIKRVDTETVAPITVITKDEIERSGKQTIAEVLRDIPSNQGQSFNETFTNSFSPGASGISLRGLGQKATLTLINGRRMANYGFAQNLQDTYVDLNSIPASAVEKIEILKDGASAIYGADAVAGVVNVILRKDYSGMEAGLTAGTSTEGGATEYRANFGVGVGDLGSDKYNVLATLDFYHRDLLKWSDRKATASGDFRDQPGGALQWGTSGALRSGLGAAPAPFIGRRNALTTCPQPTDVRRPIGVFNASLQGDACTYNLAPWLTLLPKTDRVGLYTRGVMEFSSSLSGFAEISLSNNKTFQVFTPASVRGTAFQVLPGGGFTGVSARLLLPATNPANSGTNSSTGAALAPASREIQYAFQEVGGRDAEITTNSSRFLTGLKGTASGWDYETALGAAQSDTDQQNFRRLKASIINDTTVIPTYDFRNPNAAALAPFFGTSERSSKSKLSFIDGKASTELAQLSAGPLGLAIGAEYRRESIRDAADAFTTGKTVITDPALFPAGVPVLNYLGQGSSATDGSRNSTALFAELGVPITKSLEAQIAARYDRYSDFGSATSPKIGAKWSVTPEVLLRANYGQGFRAPTLAEAAKSSSTFFTTVFDPVQGNFFTITGAVDGNPNLKPEKSKSWTIGAVIEPTKDISFGLNLYQIELKNLVQLNIQNVIDNEANLPAGAQVIRDANGFILFARDVWRNTDKIKTSGSDLDFKMKFPKIDAGEFTFRGEVSYLDSFKGKASLDAPNAVEAAGTNTSDITSGALPRVKGYVAFDWKNGAWTSTATVRYTHSVYQFGAVKPNITGGTEPSVRVGSYSDMDLFLGYEFSKNLTVSGSIRNAFDKRPPYDASYSSGVDFTLYDLRGRYVTVGATYKFK